jgi:predicted HTH transcriptional regulator
MALLDRALSAVTEADLRRLIDTGAREITVIDFKRQTYGDREKPRKDFLKDISALANTSGGDSVIGMDESDGIPHHSLGAYSTSNELRKCPFF